MDETLPDSTRHGFNFTEFIGKELQDEVLVKLPTVFGVQISGIRQHGLQGYLRHLVPPGLPELLLPIMIPVELMGMLTKPFALAIRLFANMTAGHIVIAALIGLIFLFQNWAVAPLSILGVLGVNLLEILIAFVQAYVFTLLSAVFIALAIRGDH